jgi:hypothetical protein
MRAFALREHPNNRWRIVATVRDADAEPKEAFAYHAAGVGGRGGSSYIDSVIMRDRDEKSGWTAASDGTLEERVFYVQNWRSDVVALVNAAGAPLEEVRYTAYGTPSVHPIADVDGDGVVNAGDVTAYLTYTGGGANGTVFATTDLNADGFFPDDADIEFFDDEYVRLGAGSVFGINKLSGVGNREGFGGSSWESPTRAWAMRQGKFESESGKWTRMDPLMYVDGAGLYNFLGTLTYVDRDGQRRGPILPGQPQHPIVPRDQRFPGLWEPLEPEPVVEAMACVIACRDLHSDPIDRDNCVTSCAMRGLPCDVQDFIRREGGTRDCKKEGGPGGEGCRSLCRCLYYNTVFLALGIEANTWCDCSREGPPNPECLAKTQPQVTALLKAAQAAFDACRSLCRDVA